MLDFFALVLLVVAAAALVAWLRGRGAPDRENEPTRARPAGLPKVIIEDDNDIELTKFSLPSLKFVGSDDDDGDDDEPVRESGSSIIPIVYDPQANVDVPTDMKAFFVVSAVAQTARGLRKRNEDAFLALANCGVFGVADGMGGYAGGDVASRLATETIARGVTQTRSIRSTQYREVPRRAAELVDAVVEANSKVREKARTDPRLREMGTTLVCARFCPLKARVYIAHVGDSRCYLLRNGALHQLTTDHTIGAMHGAPNAPAAKHLVRALGVRDSVEVDLIFGKPQLRDHYLLCSDGLSRILSDDEICEILGAHEDLGVVANRLIARVEELGARDNVTVVVIRIDPTADLEAGYARDLAG